MAKKSPARSKAPAAKPAAEAPKPVKVAEAKGRPMLSWVGKRPLGVVKAFPAQQVERFNAAPASKPAEWPDWPAGYPEGGLLFHGDNKEVLAHLIANGFRGKVQLIYIDPPFDSGADYVRKVSLRGPKGTAKIDGETYSLGEQIQYTDIWANDSYLQFMYERLLLLKELLSANGNVIVHCDWHRGHLIRCLLDEVFGGDAFKNEIVWRYSKYQMRGMSRFVNNHDSLLWYSSASASYYKPVTEPLDEKKLLKRKKWDSELGRIVNVRDREGQLVYDEYDEMKVDDVWELDVIGATSTERSDYPTQKPRILLERIVDALAPTDAIVLDCFLGSGTTAAVAQKFGRRWIGCDINKGAIQTTAKRLQSIMEEQAAALAPAAQGSLIDDVKDEKDKPPAPAQLGFTTWRVNDYDLQVQHLEAQALALDYLGVERSKTDGFFDGTLKRALVRMIPFDHPLSPVDLELIRKELDTRKDEDRPVTVVCLGIEIAAQAWIDDWNRHRTGRHTANRITVVELRDDPTHGGWMNHTPAEADVSISRKKDRILVTIDNFISPSIVERLKRQAGVLTPRIDDFRAMIDSVAIDTEYDGRVFNVVHADVPQKKTDLIEGRYELPAPAGDTIVAVRVTDMLGEEVLVTKAV